MTDEDNPQLQLSIPSIFRRSEEETATVARRIEAELSKWPLIYALMDHFGGLLFGAAQRFLDKDKKTGEHRPRDHAIIDSCPRLFTDCFARYLLARHGLVLQGAVLLRSAFENTTQMILFLENEEMADKWLRDEQIRPRDVRDLTAMPATERWLYKKLSNLAHQNYSALAFSSVPVPGPGIIGRASPYGGWYAPKQAGELSIQFLFGRNSCFLRNSMLRMGTI